MGKAYIDVVKYMIYATFEVDGVVDKSDVVGAIFGQTEGLLGEELELRDLQKSGRIGRIEVELNTYKGKTYGEIRIPSSLDLVETAIIAAAVETVDRVGPCDAKIKVTKVEDRRKEKRKHILERAKTILKEILEKEIPESKELTKMLKEELKASALTYYGKEKLPAGPEVGEAEEVIFVEGRADVINLLKYGFNNVVAIGGVKAPDSIKELAETKEVTLFIDGDRGGILILKELLNNGVEIDYVAQAPPGKEVEELSRKEIIKSLRAKIPLKEFLKRVNLTESGEKKEEKKEERAKQRKRRKAEKADSGVKGEGESETEEKPPEPSEPVIFSKEEIKDLLSSLSGTSNTLFLDKDFRVVKEGKVKDILKILPTLSGIYAVVFDGIITKRLLDLAHSKGVKVLAGVNMSPGVKVPEDMEVITL